MTTKQKIRMMQLEIEERKINGCRSLLGDGGRVLKSEVYADVLRRHPNALKYGRFGRVVRAVNNLLAT